MVKSIILLRLRNPSRGIIDILPQQKIELTRMMLHVPHIVQHHFKDTVIAVRVDEPVLHLFFGQAVDEDKTFLTGKFEVFKQF
jgi:hypothetical protein